MSIYRKYNYSNNTSFLVIAKTFLLHIKKILKDSVTNLVENQNKVQYTHFY